MPAMKRILIKEKAENIERVSIYYAKGFCVVRYKTMDGKLGSMYVDGYLLHARPLKSYPQTFTITRFWGDGSPAPPREEEAYTHIFSSSEFEGVQTDIYLLKLNPFGYIAIIKCPGSLTSIAGIRVQLIEK